MFMLRVVRLGWLYLFSFPFFVVGYLYCSFIFKVKVQGSLLFVTYTIIQGIISSEM